MVNFVILILYDVFVSSDVLLNQFAVIDYGLDYTN